PNLKYLDAGGGLAIDYDGTKSDSASSMNYSLQDYTDTVIEQLKNINATLITESGRAIVAEHAIYITEVIDVSSAPERKIDKKTLKTFIEGKISLRDRALKEKSSSKNRLPDIYFCNFSLFQSLPDSWAIDQLFPIMPIHRLNEENLRSAILADLTCDSDGKIDHFIGSKKTLTLPLYDNSPLYLAIFFVGAYQEVMGGLHNLFGDTNVVHAELDSQDKWQISRVVEGDTIAEVLSYIQYNPDELKRAFFERVEIALKQKKLTLDEAARIKKEFKQALDSYTYLVI
ncbi:MAG: biosynthetic arginine decarboxylase, partial [Parachlamydiaceae bacterium]